METVGLTFACVWDLGLTYFLVPSHKLFQLLQAEEDSGRLVTTDGSPAFVHLCERRLKKTCV